jgi:hypothetical protein
MDRPNCRRIYTACHLIKIFREVGKMEQRRKEEKRLRRVVQVTMAYLCWQAIFPVIALSAGWLTPDQMGYTLRTALMGLLVGIIVTVVLAVLDGTRLGVSLYVRGLHHIKTSEELESFWNTTLRGCDDGIIAETHWSGTVLPLLMMGFEIIGVPYPFNAIPAIFVRWVLHVSAHLMFPRGGAQERIFGGLGFFGMGLLISDTANSASFLVSGSIIAPAMLHHLMGYVSIWVGNKEKIAKRLGIPLSKKT